MFDILRDAPSSPPRAREAASSAAGDGELSSSEPRQNMIPSFDVDFWRVYGNKLRCYGTQEEVCDLTGKLGQVTGMRQEDIVPGLQSVSDPQREHERPGGPKSPATDETLVARKSSLWLLGLERALRIFT